MCYSVIKTFASHGVHLPDARGIARNSSAHQLNKGIVDCSLILCLRTSYEAMLNPYPMATFATAAAEGATLKRSEDQLLV
jgi:hypothetical protein